MITVGWSRVAFSVNKEGLHKSNDEADEDDPVSLELYVSSGERDGLYPEHKRTPPMVRWSSWQSVAIDFHSE